MVKWKSFEGLSDAEWQLLRLNSIGASEVGTICVGSNFSSNLELYYQKIGLGKPTVKNIRMDIGTETEPLTFKYWRYYEGSEASIIANKQNGRIIKNGTCKKETAFNDKYPHLSVSPDARIQPYGIYEGMGEGCLEIKNTMEYVLKSYENGLPLGWIFQIATQLMVTEFKYGELFLFVDNRRFQLEPLTRKTTKKLEETILIHTTDFWERVTKARPVVNQMFEFRRTYNMKAADEALREIQQLEPPVQNTRGYMDFLTEQYKERAAGAGIKEGTAADLELARKHKQIAKKISALEKEKQLVEIHLKQIMKESNQLDFGKNGKINFYPNVNGNRTFKNNII